MSFEKACQDSEQLKQVITRPEMLKLHGYYKQAMYGDNTNGRPSMADIDGLAKWQHWRNLENMSEGEARIKYSELVNECLIKYKDVLQKLQNI